MLTQAHTLQKITLQNRVQTDIPVTMKYQTASLKSKNSVTKSKTVTNETERLFFQIYKYQLLNYTRLFPFRFEKG